MTKRGRTFTPPACRQAGCGCGRLRAWTNSGRRTGTASCGWPPARCTRRSATRAANAESVLRVARECHDDGVGAGGVPRADAVRLLDRGHPAAGRAAGRGRGRALADVVAASAELLPVLVVGAPLRYRHRIYNTAVVIHRGRVLGRRAEVVPADLPGVLRAPPDRARRRRARARSGSAGVEVPFGPDLLFAADRPARASCCTSRSARTCWCRCRRARRRRWPARRCWPTCPAARSPSAAPRTAACWPARRRRAAWPPTCTPRRARASRPPTWPGTARR